MLRIEKMVGVRFWQSIPVNCFKSLLMQSLVILNLLTALNTLNDKHQQLLYKILNFSYESGDGSKAEQSGELKEVEEGKFGEVIHGSYQYVAPDGQVVAVSYVADENGFQPQGEHLPQAPELPASVARALKFIEEHPQTEQPATNSANKSN